MSGARPTAVRWSRRLAPVVVAAAILVASVSEPSGGPPAPPAFGLPADKLLHGTAYALLAATLAVGLATPAGATRRVVTRRRVVALALAGAAIYGLAMEGLQYPLPHRTFDLLDAVANTGGAAVGSGLWAVAAPVRRWLTHLWQ